MIRVSVTVRFQVLTPENWREKIVRVFLARARPCTTQTKEVEFIGILVDPIGMSSVSVWLPEQDGVAWLRKMRNQLDNLLLSENGCPPRCVLGISVKRCDFRVVD